MTEQQIELTLILFKELLKTVNKEQLDIIAEFLIKRFDEDNKIDMSDKQIDAMICQIKRANKERIINDLRNYLNL